MVRTLVAIVALSLCCAGCGGDDKDSSPAPTPTQPSAPTTTLKLRFSPNFICGSSFTFCPDYSAADAPTISVQIRLKLPSTCPANELDGSLTWNPNVATNTTQTLGPYMQQGGVLPTLTVSRTASSLTFSIIRPNNTPDVSGEGVFLMLPFTVAPAAVAGAVTTLHWTSAAATPKLSLISCLGGLPDSARDQDIEVIRS